MYSLTDDKFSSIIRNMDAPERGLECERRQVFCPEDYDGEGELTYRGQNQTAACPGPKKEILRCCRSWDASNFEHFFIDDTTAAPAEETDEEALPLSEDCCSSPKHAPATVTSLWDVWQLLAQLHYVTLQRTAKWHKWETPHMHWGHPQEGGVEEPPRVKAMNDWVRTWLKQYWPVVMEEMTVWRRIQVATRIHIHAHTQHKKFIAQVCRFIGQARLPVPYDHTTRNRLAALYVRPDLWEEDPLADTLRQREACISVPKTWEIHEATECDAFAAREEPRASEKTATEAGSEGERQSESEEERDIETVCVEPTWETPVLFDFPSYANQLCGPHGACKAYDMDETSAAWKKLFDRKTKEKCCAGYVPMRLIELWRLASIGYFETEKLGEDAINEAKKVVEAALLRFRVSAALQKGPLRFVCNFISNYMANSLLEDVKAEDVKDVRGDFVGDAVKIKIGLKLVLQPDIEDLVLEKQTGGKSLLELGTCVPEDMLAAYDASFPTFKPPSDADKKAPWLDFEGLLHKACGKKFGGHGYDAPSQMYRLYKPHHAVPAHKDFDKCLPGYSHVTLRQVWDYLSARFHVEHDILKPKWPAGKPSPSNKKGEPVKWEDVTFHSPELNNIYALTSAEIDKAFSDMYELDQAMHHVAHAPFRHLCLLVMRAVKDLPDGLVVTLRPEDVTPYLSDSYKDLLETGHCLPHRYKDPDIVKRRTKNVKALKTNPSDVTKALNAYIMKKLDHLCGKRDFESPNNRGNRVETFMLVAIMAALLPLLSTYIGDRRIDK
ncbi:unnamed protein product [Vitrella brassicaformis CCMP3155]|uniref:Uncharacterized protein n=1 Tax=Vitrella brassicaformis (strain CCMP3155) TaxID=1169540 RepID=A0A0G4EHX4_VITBC|nr:unnamed protein product [Vitrella brassicaformis CCMP3155]|eukprot:CEL95831.1 unnamed protein product [Vitrella brassicaformis CCMP3155]